MLIFYVLKVQDGWQLPVSEEVRSFLGTENKVNGKNYY